MKSNRSSNIWKVSKEDLQEIINKCSSINEVLGVFGKKNKGGNSRTLMNRVKEDNIDMTMLEKNRTIRVNQLNVSRTIPLESILVDGSDYSRGKLKARLLRDNLLENKCKICNQNPIWNDEPLVLVLDHINGKPDDNRLENLRLICPNCHSQTKTFAGRNIGSVESKRKCIECNKEIIGIYKNMCDDCIYSKNRVLYICYNCGKDKKDKESKYCVECWHLLSRKVDRPTLEQLISETKTYGFNATGRKYNVSSTTIRKWIRIMTNQSLLKSVDHIDK